MGKIFANGINMFFKIQFFVQNDTQKFTGVIWTHCVTQKLNGVQHGFTMAHKMTFLCVQVQFITSKPFCRFINVKGKIRSAIDSNSRNIGVVSKQDYFAFFGNFW